MKLKTFNLQLDEYGELDSSAMDAELEGCEVLSVWEHFVPTERVWLIMVGYRVASTRRERGEETSPRARHSRQRVKAADQLDPQERAIYESLRAWRRALAQARQIGPHFILTNAQLIEVIKRRPMTLTTLGEIRGIGEGKLKDFGQSLIHALGEAEAQAQRTVGSVQDPERALDPEEVR